MNTTIYPRRGLGTTTLKPVRGPCGHRYLLRVHRMCPFCAIEEHRLREQNAEWIKTEAACRLLGMTTKSAPALKQLEHRKALSARGMTGRRATIYRLADIQRTARLMVELRVSAAAAIRIVAAHNAGHLDQLLDGKR